MEEIKYKSNEGRPIICNQIVTSYVYDKNKRSIQELIFDSFFEKITDKETQAVWKF